MNIFMKTCLMILLLFLFGWYGLTAFAQEATYNAVDLQLNESISENIIVEITEEIPKADVVFAFDLTGSMSGVLETAKKEALTIMDSLGGIVGDIRFAVISHTDYPGQYSSCGYQNDYGVVDEDYPYKLEKSLTSSKDDISRTINGLNISYTSQDYPESYTRVLFESYSDPEIGYRKDAKKMLIFFADDVPHDCNLNREIPGSAEEWSTGADPGRDGKTETPDDLVLLETLEEMRSQGVTLLMVYSGLESYANYWEYWSGLTGGDAFLLSSAADVPRAVKELVGSEARYIQELTLKTSEGYDDWISNVEPSSYMNIEAPATRTFRFTITVPDNAKQGEHTFDVYAVGDGATYTSKRFEISVQTPNGETEFEPTNISKEPPSQTVVATTVATVGSIVAAVVTASVSGKAQTVLALPRMSESIKTERVVRVSRLRQLYMLVISILFVAILFSLASAALPNLLYSLELPTTLPLIGDSIPIEYLANIATGVFISVLPIILISSAIVFLWRIILGGLTSLFLGVKTALVGSKIGAVSLMATTALTAPMGFPMTSIYQTGMTKRQRGYLALAKNLGLLILLLPFYYAVAFGSLGSYGALISEAGMLIVLMTFFYTMLPVTTEGKDLFRCNKGLSILLMIIGLVLFLDFKFAASLPITIGAYTIYSLPKLVYPAFGVIALVSVFLIFVIIPFFRGSKRRESVSTETSEEVVKWGDEQKGQER